MPALLAICARATFFLPSFDAVFPQQLRLEGAAVTMHVHFVGSVGLDTAEDVFAAVGSAVKPYIKRCPDGEIGGRRSWISWQWPLLRAMAFLELDEARQTRGVGLAPLRVKKGVGAGEMHFGEVGYAGEAYT